MLEASSLRSRKQSYSPTDLKLNNNSNNYINNNNNGTTRSVLAKDKSKTKDREKLSMTNDTKTSVSEAVVTSDSPASKDPAVGVLALGHETASSQGTPATDEEGEEGEIDEDEDTSMKSPSPSITNASQQRMSRNLAPSRIRSSKLSAEDLNGGLLDGTLDDEDEDMEVILRTLTLSRMLKEPLLPVRSTRKKRRARLMRTMRRKRRRMTTTSLPIQTTIPI